MAEREAVMPSIIKPLKKTKKSKFKKKYIASNKRWSQVVVTYKEKTMPTPEGIITTSDIYVTEPPVEQVEEEKIPWEEVKKDLGIEIDLPELS